MNIEKAREAIYSALYKASVARYTWWAMAGATVVGVAAGVIFG